MKIAVSACLLGEQCKYNGESNYRPELAELLKDHEVIQLCPEVTGGMSVPRPAAERRDDKVVTYIGRDVTREYKRGAKFCMEQIEENGIELVILKARSPACGKDQIYDGSFTGKLVERDGVLAELVRSSGIPFYSDEETDAIRTFIEEHTTENAGGQE